MKSAKPRGRPAGKTPKTKHTAIRIPVDELPVFEAEFERRTKLTGQEWNMTSYALFAMRKCLGGPIGGGK